MAMSFLPKCYTAVNCLLFYKETGDSTLYHFFLYCDVAIFFMLCESGFLTKYSSISYIKRKKKQVNCRAWGQEIVHISVIARVRNSGSLFQSFLYCVSPGGLVLVRIGGVSVRRESTVYRIAFAPARKSYRLRLLFTHKNGCSSVISVT